MCKRRTTGALASSVQDTSQYTMASNFPPGKCLSMFPLFRLTPAIKNLCFRLNLCPLCQKISFSFPG